MSKPDSSYKVSYNAGNLRMLSRHVMSSLDSRVAVIILVFFILLAILKPFLIGPYPIVFEDIHGIHFGFLLKDYNIQAVHWQIDHLLSYTPYELHMDRSLLSPFADYDPSMGYSRHWLGTDIIGRDVLSGILNGISIAFKVGFISSMIAFVVGVTIGGVGAYFGNIDFKMSLWSLWILLLVGIFGLYFAYFDQQLSDTFYSINQSWILLLLGVFSIYMIERYSNARALAMPLDALVVRILEFFKSIPAILILLVLLASIQSKSIWHVIFIIAFLRWATIARYARAEMLSVKTLEYIKAVKSSGLSDWRILYRHALPNTLPSVIIVTAFGVSMAILLESTLSFLGLGLDAYEVTWGSMLSEARRNFSAWWLAVFPGVALFLVVASINILAEKLNEILNPKLKSQNTPVD